MVTRQAGRWRTICVVFLAAAALAGCGSMSSFELRDLVPDFTSDSGTTSGLGFTASKGALPERKLRPTTAADFVSADGQCAEAPPETTGTAPAEKPAPTGATPAAGTAAGTATGAAGTATPFPTQGIGLTMTECALVAVAGAPDQVNIGAGKSGERKAVLTYTKGDHPGIYTFVDGRLKVVDELPTAAKPERNTRAAKRRPAKTPARQPASVSVN